MAALAVASMVALSSPPASAAAELPRRYLDSTYAPGPGAVLIVNAGDSLQAALDKAQPGDTIVLQAGATFTGTFILRDKGSSAAWIYIRTSGYANLPSPGQRVAPADSAQMAVIAGTGAPVIAFQTEGAAHHYRFVGLEIRPAAGLFATALIRLGANEVSEAQLPHDIIFDRCYIHGDPVIGGRRGISVGSAATAVVDSYMADWKESGADSQAILIWNTPGPVKLVNNYLEGAGENVMVGGVDPTIADLVPSDIEIRHNRFAKPVAWRTQAWTVKNLFELKNSRRTLVEGNVFENDWAQAQSYAINVKSVNQDGSAPWSVTRDVTFRSNIVRHAPSAIKLCGVDCDGAPTAQGGSYLIENNLFDDISASNWGGEGNFLLTMNPTPGLVIRHNTVIHDGNAFTAGDGGEGADTGFVFTDNILQSGPYGFKGSGAAPGTGTLQTFFPGYVFAKNAIVGAAPAYYPPDDFFPATYAAVGFVDAASGNYRLAATSAYRNAGTDGRDLGADIDALATATSGTGTNGVATNDSPPVVATTSPVAGATLSGTVELVADASDDTGLAGVSFLLDGKPLGSEIASSPYQLAWNTGAVSDGAHTISALARDVAGHTSVSTTVAITVANSAGANRAPYGGTPVSIPGRIEAENFDEGGEGVAYHDATPGNQGQAWRNDADVDIIMPKPDLYVVNNFEVGEWMEYTVQAARDGDFVAEARVSSTQVSGRFRIEVDGIPRTLSVLVPITGSWQTFQWLGGSSFHLAAGRHVVRLVAEGQYFNVDAIRLRRP